MTATAKTASTVRNGASTGAVESTLSQLVGFRLGGEEYGVDIMKVQEIILPGEITEVPQVPDFIRGLINLRGHVIPIVDLRKRFGLAASEPTEETRIVVLNMEGRTIGAVVDSVSEVLRISPEQVEPPPPGVAEENGDYVIGLVKLPERLLILLNANALVSEEEQMAESGR